VGDLVLREFVERVRASVRSIDILVRRGGEEFVLIMPSTAGQEAHRVAERIRRCLAGRPLSVGGGAVAQTVSIGVATWNGTDAPELLEDRADRAMYAAKRAGRNRVAVAR
jgi:two-component system cell cycle response regulator